MNRLHEKGYISDPRSKAKSVVFTEDGLTRAAHLLEESSSPDTVEGGTRPLTRTSVVASRVHRSHTRD